jgi:glycosyltransferase involved in cell wall biosynthesis
MRILFATEYYPPFAPGGSSWSIAALAEALARRGHQVSVVTPNYGAAKREEMTGVSVVRFPFWRRLNPGASLAPTRALVSPRFHFRLSRAVAAEARRMGADVIHAQDKHALVGSFLAARAMGRPVFLTLRDTGLICPIVTCLLSHEFVPGDCSAVKLQRECAGFFLDHYVRGGLIRRARVRVNLALLYADARVKKFLLGRLDGLVSVSQGLLEIYLRAGRGRRETARVVYTLPPDGAPADAALVHALRARHGLDGRKAVLYVGKLSLGKGGPVFLKAVERVGAARPDTVFLVVGPDRPPGLAAADIRWLGRLNHPELLALYQAVDLVVLPSVGPEALSRVPLEAATAGRPTIGARAGGIPEEIVDGETGLLVERNDAAALARAMLHLFDHDQLRMALGQNARHFVAKQFHPDALVGSLLDMYAAARR